MRSSDVIMRCVIVMAMLCSSVLSAPVLQEAPIKDVINAGKNIENQEQELENLIQLAHNQESQGNVQVEKIHKLTVEEHNGAKIEDHVMEEKVVNPEDGSVVADIKQEVKEVKSGDEVQPEAVVETEVNIPSAGIDEKFVKEAHDVDVKEPSIVDDHSDDNNEDEIVPAIDDNGDEDLNDMADESDEEDDMQDLPSNAIPLTTQDMAEYLFVTQQFDQFLPALERLVDMQKMTASDAASYAKDVIEEYEKLDMEVLRESMSYDKRMAPPVYPVQYQPISPPVPVNIGGYGYPAYLTPQEQYYLEQEQEQQQQQQQMQYMPRQPIQQAPQQSFDMTNEAVDPLDFLTLLYDAAYGKDNAEAKEVIQLLYDRVSMDDNPDDLGQIRDLLVDTLSSSVYNNEYAPQPSNTLPIEDNFLMSPNFQVGNDDRQQALEQVLNNDEEDDMTNDAVDGDDDDVVQTKGEEVKRSGESSSVDNHEDKETKSDDSQDLENDLVNVSHEQNKPVSM